MTGEPEELPRHITEPCQVIAEIVAGLEPQMAAADIAAAVAEVSPHRPRMRELAQALVNDPELLTSERPEGPVNIQTLIQALLYRGAVHVRPPRCGHCGGVKPLRSRDGDQRICAWCDMKRRGASQPCVVCGLRRHVAFRDRQGRPRCVHCPPEDDQDPTQGLCDLIGAVQTGLTRETVEQVIVDVMPKPSHQRKLLWTLQEDSGLLTGQGFRGSPRLLALIEALIGHGAQTVVMPSCPFCGTAGRPLTRVRDGLRCCRRCWEQPRTEQCARCGRDKDVGSRTLEGRALCHACWRSDPLSHDECTGCGRRTTIVFRTFTQAHCRRCWNPPAGVCSICGQHRPCYFASTEHARCHACTRRINNTNECSSCGRLHITWARTPDGEPLCSTCSRRIEECVICGRQRDVAARLPEGLACRTCYREHPASRRHCRQCGTFTRLYHHGLCDGCACLRMLADLLSGPNGQLRPEAQAVFDALVDGDPRSMLLWLRQPAPRGILTAIGHADEPLTHEFLDQLQPRQAVRHLRAVLVNASTLPPRDEQLITLERWLKTTLGQLTDPDQRALLHRFVTWTHLRQLRRQKTISTYEQITVVRREVRNSIQLMDWLRSRGRTLATATQANIDAWLAEGTRGRHDARPFILWATERGHAHDIEVPSRPQDNLRSTFLHDDKRWTLIHRLLHDDELAVTDRVAGLLVMLFAQPLTRICCLTTQQITRDDGHLCLALGTHPLQIPPPLDDLITKLIETRTSRAAHGNTTQHPWLFPGGTPGQHLSPRQLMRRLQRVNIPTRLSRNTAMVNLAAERPGAGISHLLGLHPDTAEKWTREAGTPRAGYAAELARRDGPVG